MGKIEVCGKELELDLFDADTMERFEKANEKVVEMTRTVQDDKDLSNADGIRQLCHSIKGFFDDVFGAGTAQTLFGEKDNLYDCTEAYAIAAGEMQKVKPKMENLLNRYGKNRAERRADHKKKHGNRNQSFHTVE